MEKKRYRTAGRQLLTDYLSQTARLRPQSAKEIYQGLSQTERAPGRSSIYRQIAAMCAEGSLRRSRGSDENEYLYQYVGAQRACESHFHLQCLACGRILHLECGCSTEIAEHLMEKHGFSVDSGRSVFYGRCADCRPAETEAK